MRYRRSCYFMWKLFWVIKRNQFNYRNRFVKQYISYLNIWGVLSKISSSLSIHDWLMAWQWTQYLWKHSPYVQVCDVKLVLECLGCLNELATHNSVQLVWVPGHECILGNKSADELAKKGADTPFTGPEPVLGIPYSVVKRAIRDWMERKHIECWKSSKDWKLFKALMEGSQQSRDNKLLSMSR